MIIVYLHLTYPKPTETLKRRMEEASASNVTPKLFLEVDPKDPLYKCKGDNVDPLAPVLA